MTVNKEALLAELAQTEDQELLARVARVVQEWYTEDEAFWAEIDRRDKEPEDTLIPAEEVWKEINERILRFRKHA